MPMRIQSAPATAAAATATVPTARPVARRGFTFAVALLLVAGAAVGCRSSNKTKASTTARPASAADVQAIRNAYFRAYPESRVGVIIATRPQDRLVAVGQVNPSDFAQGQSVYFLDSQRHVLATGRIVRVLSDSVHAEYEPPAAGRRAPKTGDVMVRLPVGATPL
jgi:hypothetical protein